MIKFLDSIVKNLSGKKISRKKAFEGLGNPNNWETFKKEIMEEFKRKPPKDKF